MTRRICPPPPPLPVFPSAPAQPVWTLDWVRCHRLQSSSAYLYLLVDEPRGLPLAATVSDGPQGTRLAAWLEAAALGRGLPATIRLASPPHPADVCAFRNWLLAHNVAIPWLSRPPEPFDPSEVLMQSALRSLDAVPAETHAALIGPAVQQRLETWSRTHGQR